MVKIRGMSISGNLLMGVNRSGHGLTVWGNSGGIRSLLLPGLAFMLLSYLAARGSDQLYLTANNRRIITVEAESIAVKADGIAVSCSK